jgi:hypothetical protein
LFHNQTNFRERQIVSSSSGIPAGVCVVVTRLALCFWVGGAALFVVTSVAEQQHSRFDSVIRDQLATIRFPHYYQFGGICLGTALLASAVAAVLSRGCLRKTMLAVLVFTVLSAAIAVVDYGWVYRPLQEMIIPPGLARPAQFLTLHKLSPIINVMHLSMALIAAVIACLPEHRGPAATPSSPQPCRQ